MSNPKNFKKIFRNFDPPPTINNHIKMEFEKLLDQEIEKIDPQDLLDWSKNQKTEPQNHAKSEKDPLTPENKKDNLSDFSDLLASNLLSQQPLVPLSSKDVSDLLGLSDFAQNTKAQNFRAGLLLKNKQNWLVALDKVLAAGGEVPVWIKGALEEGGVDLFNKHYFTTNKNFNYKFNGKTYKKDELEGMHFANYNGAQVYQEKLLAELEDFCKAGIALEVSKQQVLEEKATVNPLNYIFDEVANKGRMILHWTFNSGYTKPKLFLKTPFNFTKQLLRAKSGLKNDLKKAFYQVPLKQSNWRRVACQVNGRYFYILVLPMGASPSVLILQSFNDIACQYFSLVTGDYASCFVDDFLSLGEKGEDLDILLGRLGYIFAPEKRLKGSILDYVGYEIDFT